MENSPPCDGPLSLLCIDECFAVHFGTLILTITCPVSETSCWMCTGERQSAKIRAEYLRATLRQDVGYFDSPSSSTAEVVNNVAADASLVQEAMSEKVRDTFNDSLSDAWNSAVTIMRITNFHAFQVLGCRWGTM